MKRLYLALLFIVISIFALNIATPAVTFAATRVKGYTNKNTYKYVAPHYRTKKNSSKLDNYSTKGNSNPFTGKKGTNNPYSVKKKYR